MRAQNTSITHRSSLFTYFSWKWEFLNFEKTSEIRENRRIQFYPFPQDLKTYDATKKIMHAQKCMCCITPGTKYLKWLKLTGRCGQNHFMSKHFSWKIQDGEVQVLYVYVNISAENRCIGMFDGLMKSWDSARQHETIEKMIKRKKQKSPCISK